MNVEMDKRIAYMDYLRVAATVAVITLHVAAQNWGNVDIHGSDWMIFNFYDSIVRWSVPVFVMISGALFLDKDVIPIKKIYSKYVLRMVVAYVVWSFIYYLLSGGESVSSQLVALTKSGKSDCFIAIVNSHYHLWFVLMISGIYVCLPIIKQIVNNEKIAIYFLILSFIFWFAIPQAVEVVGIFGSEKQIAIINAFYGKISGMQLSLVMNFCFYFILGYMLSKVRIQRRMIIYILGMIGFVFTIIMTKIVTIKLNTPSEIFYSNTSLNVLAEAVAVFEVYKNIPFKSSTIFGKGIGTLSRWSFGAYCVHILIIEQLEKYGVHTLSFSPIITMPILILVVFICSFAVSGIIHAIPVVRKYIV